jgi:ABC-type cobalamin/Fe3+-siderophores transport system ATPase subunit
MRIAVIGICGAGKSTLVQGLRMLGFDAKQVNQEHSEVKLLWERFYQPDVLIWLDAGDAEIARRLGTNLEPWLIAR